jgi:hypothetical protein
MEYVSRLRYASRSASRFGPLPRRLPRWHDDCTIRVFMRDRAFWYSDPEALLAGAAQALDAKRQLGRRIDRDWSYVDANLGEVLFLAVRDVPDRPVRRRREDRRLVDWIGRLVAELADDDPYREQVLRRLRQVI